jgi:AraC-like DNA-binding protein
MPDSNIYIKNMVCSRCIKVVKEECAKLGLPIAQAELGKVVLEKVPTEKELKALEQALKKNGFALILDRQQQTIEQVKILIIEHVHHQKYKPIARNFSDYLAEQLQVNYFTLSKLFSAEEGITIEKFIIVQKIEKAKELLSYDQLTLSEIAFQMDYSSPAHLSTQFKKVTGLTPTAFKQSNLDKRKPIDEL